MGNRVIQTLAVIVTLACLGACRSDRTEYGDGRLRVSIAPGEEWEHGFPLFLGIKVNNTPQMAVWVADTLGRYVADVYVTDKAATQGWMMAGGSRRQEALPVWSHAHGVRYADGLYLPTSDEPLPDAVTGATPRGGFCARTECPAGLERFAVMIEVNHSTDFNATWPRDAEPGTAAYSGGKEGSGQPSVVYRADVDLTSGAKAFEARLIGHGSADGSDGRIYLDVSRLTTALHIVSAVSVSVE